MYSRYTGMRCDIRELRANNVGTQFRNPNIRFNYTTVGIF